jgi:glycosyltransferase involved in cell wall biosynthesis
VTRPRRIAIVVPRYGHEINGGAESLARSYASRLADHADVTVLTTCALDYRTWGDHFPPGEERDGAVRVLRFSVPQPRDEAAFDAMSPRVLSGSASADEEQAWMDAQGPVSPDLEQHLRENGDIYDAVLFVPYLYATTARALPIVADRSVLVSAFHDEPPLRLSLFDDVVSQAQSVVVSTPEERDLAVKRFRVPDDRLHVVGAGIDTSTAGDTHAFRQRLGLERGYVLALGRIDPSKGTADLVRFHRAYREREPEGLDLVMIGRSVMELPEAPWLHTPGFVDEQTKADAIAGCTALVSASPFESLSLVLLEAWAQGRPVVVTTQSEVLVGQTRRAGGGLWFSGKAEYAAALHLLSTRPALAWGLGRSGWRFAQTLDWDEVTARLLIAVDRAVSRNGRDAT